MKRIYFTHQINLEIRCERTCLCFGCPLVGFKLGQQPVWDINLSNLDLKWSVVRIVQRQWLLSKVGALQWYFLRWVSLPWHYSLSVLNPQHEFLCRQASPLAKYWRKRAINVSSETWGDNSPVALCRTNTAGSNEDFWLLFHNNRRKKKKTCLIVDLQPTQPLGRHFVNGFDLQYSHYLRCKPFHRQDKSKVTLNGACPVSSITCLSGMVRFLGK